MRTLLANPVDNSSSDYWNNVVAEELWRFYERRPCLGFETMRHATLLWLCFGTLITWPQLVNAEDIRHRLLVADSSSKRIAIIDEQGATEWEAEIGPLHDLHYLPNGHVLFQRNWTELIEVEPSDGKVVWRYDSANSPGNAGRRIEVHAFQRLDNGLTMIAESGASRIIEVDADGNVVHTVALQVSKPDAHRDTRLVRKLANGNYLVCHEGDGVVREYSYSGDIVWEFSVPLFGRSAAGGHGPEAWGNQCFTALRLSNGNTLVSTGNGHSVIEVTPGKDIVWKLTAEDLPGIELAWITTLQVLQNGNIVLDNCHAGERNPQLIEVDRNKKIVWQFRDFDRFGNSLTNTQVLSNNGHQVVAVLGVDR